MEWELHRDHRETANTWLKDSYLLRYLRDLRHIPVETLLEGRYQKVPPDGCVLKRAFPLMVLWVVQPSDQVEAENLPHSPKLDNGRPAADDLSK